MQMTVTVKQILFFRKASSILAPNMLRNILAASDHLTNHLVFTTQNVLSTSCFRETNKKAISKLNDLKN